MKNQIENFPAYRDHYQRSQNNPEEYWASVAKEFTWFRPWDSVQEGDFKNLNITWFKGGTTNLSTNCLDRHLLEKSDKTALIYVPNDPKAREARLSYGELHEKVCQFSHMLAEKGIKKGDVVCFYMGMTPELLIGVLACTRIGAIHSVVFGGFSALALAGRIEDSKAKMVITHDGAYRGDKVIELKKIVDEAKEKTSSVKNVIVFKRTNSPVTLNSSEFWGEELLESAPKEFKACEMEAEDPLFILYTSGSTGKPKGLLHTTGGYMVHAGFSFNQVFQMKEESDIFWCTADIGWITGHTYLTYGPLLNGATTVMFEGVPTWPDAGRFWQVVEKLKVTHFYTAPTAIRALEAFGDKFITPYDLSSLKVLGTVGEPINEEAWEWYHQKIGKERCPIVDTWWQTETGGILISPLAGITPLKPSHATYPLPGVFPILVDAEGRELTETSAEGNLCLKTPWPGMARTIYGDHERYRQTYFSAYPGYYFTGDGAKRDSEGMYRITGRVDDVINVSGHRIGTAEVEDAIDEHPKVYEAAVVGAPHAIKGQGIYAFVISSDLKKYGNPEGTRELKKEIDQLITKIIGPIAKTDQIMVVSGLPKTRSGKIMRRILRKVAAGEVDQLGDISTLLNPEIVTELINNLKLKQHKPLKSY